MKLTGVFAPLPTPFADDDQLDVRRLRAASRWWVASPLTGFVVLGSNGEAALIDDDESDRVVAARATRCRGERPFIVGTGRESTQAAIRAAKRAAELGADAVLVRTPGFFKTQMTDDVFVRHYTAVADASPVPVLLYNFTAVTGVNLLPATVARLARASEHRRHEGIGRRHRADRRSRVVHAGDVQRARGLGVDVLSGAVRRRVGRHPRAGGAAAGRRACGCSS